MQQRLLHILLYPTLNFFAYNFIKKETLAQVFSYEFCEISKNTFFTEHLRRLLLNQCITILYLITILAYLT